MNRAGDRVSRGIALFVLSCAARSAHAQADPLNTTPSRQAIDEAAIRLGETSGDDYLAGWTRGEWTPAPGGPAEVCHRVVADLEERWSAERLAAYLDALGSPFEWDVQQAGVAGVVASGDPLPPATLASIRERGLAKAAKKGEREAKDRHHDDGDGLRLRVNHRGTSGGRRSRRAGRPARLRH